MDTSQRTSTRKALRPSAVAGLFFLFFYLYAWLIVDPRLIYQGLGIFTAYRYFAFHTGWPFFLEHPAHVGVPDDGDG